MAKQRRLFVNGTEATDDCWFYCGGPDDKQASEGLKHTIAHLIWQLMNGEFTSASIDLEVREMTDEEVAELPDC